MNNKDDISTILAKLLWSLQDFRDLQNRDSLKTIEDISTILNNIPKKDIEVEW